MARLKELIVIGLNSGTSMDGVDAAAFKIRPAGTGDTTCTDNSSGPVGKYSTGACSGYSGAVRTKSANTSVPLLHIEMIGSLLYEYEPLFQRNLKRLVSSGATTLDELCRVDAALGVVFSRAACTLMRNLELTRQTVDLIGSHGQTVWHAPQERTLWEVPTRNTMQLGQPDIIAAGTGVKVIADFRTADMAAGGQGAPLTPFADQVLFGSLRRSLGVLNLGGIANITVLNEQGLAVTAYDAGPGNMLIDRAATVLYDRDYDNGGKLAAGGTVDEQWLQELKAAQPYYAMPPPKTTGRELFGYSCADLLCKQGQTRGLRAADVLATLTALTASVLAESYINFVAPRIHIEELILGGGGSRNEYLRRMLIRFWPHQLKLSDHETYGISSKFKESLLFALLAYTTFFEIPNNIPACTGASRQVCLGRLSLPPC